MHRIRCCYGRRAGDDGSWVHKGEACMLLDWRGASYETIYIESIFTFLSCAISASFKTAERALMNYSWNSINKNLPSLIYGIKSHKKTPTHPTDEQKCHTLSKIYWCQFFAVRVAAFPQRHRKHRHSYSYIIFVGFVGCVDLSLVIHRLKLTK